MSAKIYVKPRDIVAPGDLIAEGNVQITPNSMPYVNIVNGKVYAAVIGMVDIPKNNTINLIPLESVYVPKPGDVVIGLVTDFALSHWEVDINSPYKGILTAAEVLGRPFNPAQDDLSKYLNIGDYIIAKVEVFDRSRDPFLTIKGPNLGRITEGRVIEIKPSRVPRAIGKKGSMLNVLKSDTGCDIVIGMNGRIWFKCPNKDLEDVLTLALKLIERESHLSGLTEKVKVLIVTEKDRRGLK